MPADARDGSVSPVLERAKGFAAGTLSGVTKLVVGHPPDTIKIRMQVSPPGSYNGPFDVIRTMIRKEGVRSFYKGAAPPAIGWAISDSMLMGSLHTYRLFLGAQPLFQRRKPGADPMPAGSATAPATIDLSLPGHALSGAMAGMTVCCVATPTELLKAKLQMQLHTIVRHSGVSGLWHGFGSTLLFRSWFAAFFTTYELSMRQLRQTSLSPGASNFVAGGISSFSFWLGSFAFDSVKNRLMADDFIKPRYPTWRSAAAQIWSEGGIRAFYRGLTPCLIRAAPTNASALFVWETTMRMLNAPEVR